LFSQLLNNFGKSYLTQRWLFSWNANDSGIKRFLQFNLEIGLNGFGDSPGV
jgi:hypothetical protein